MGADPVPVPGARGPPRNGARSLIPRDAVGTTIKPDVELKGLLVQVPVQIVFRDMPVSDAAEAVCWEEAANLEQYYGRITSCRVVISDGRQGRGSTDQYVVDIDLTIPGAEIVVRREPVDGRAEDGPSLAIREAFDKAYARLRTRIEAMIVLPVEAMSDDELSAALGAIHESGRGTA